MNLQTVVDQIARNGGILELNPEDRIRVALPQGMGNLMDVLRERKPELLELLRRVGGRVAQFPRCTQCHSYALYRQNSVGDFECLTCGLQGIEEPAARAYDDEHGGPLQ